METEIPVYLFLGFLESGKTTFIQETMEDERFDSGERTLVLVLEEGEVEYDPSRFAVKNFAVETVDTEHLSVATLTELCKKHSVERVVVECNGMQTLDAFFEAMPDGWAIAQVMTFFDAGTFLQYNANMRQLVFDKIQYADMVVFNRFREDYSQEEFHKIVRAVSRRPGIVYEYEGGRAVYDEIEDPLPYDIEADEIVIDDRDYAFFYRDLMENMERYDGKTVTFKGMVAVDRRMQKGTLVVGRHIMTCCEADITYSGIVCLCKTPLPLKTRDWVRLTAQIRITYHKIYGQEGPVLYVSGIGYADAPEQELATFY
ncbi:MAG: GTPase [Clostridiales bacterium]|nr:GTPase [Clostridiales bacterium]